MKRLFLLQVFLLVLSTVIHAQVKLTGLRTENRVNPMGLDIRSPRFSWQLTSAKRNVLQLAYELRVARSVSELVKGRGLEWSSGKMASDSSVLVSYKGPELRSGKKYFWQVRVWDQDGKASSWSEPAWWQTGLLQPSDWKAKWIESGLKEDSAFGPCPYLRKEFASSKKVQSATASITARGVYEFFMNGQRVGRDHFNPGWTSYHKRLQYATYDVTPLLKNGANAIGVVLGSGWYRGELGWAKQTNLYGDKVALLLQLEIQYADGSAETVISDGTWKASSGPIRTSEIYDGETYDARKELPGWSVAGYPENGWQPVVVKDHPLNHLVAAYNEPIRKQETFKAKLIITPKGEQVLDFGQNLVGWVQVKARGRAGDRISLAHFESLDKNGEPYFANLRNAKATDTFILKGNGEEVFEPHFTFHGFRYARVNGTKAEPSDFTAVALYSDMQPAGNFVCSDEMLNRLQQNIQWSQRGNFLDVPTDCPQRDERLGWTGDAQVFARTAMFNMQAHNFFVKWLKDVAADQKEDGGIPFVVPDLELAGFRNAYGAAGWADAATIIPWQLYQIYGDKRVIEEQYPSMKAWVGYMQSKSPNDLWNTGFQFGDWLSFRTEENNFMEANSAITDRYLVAQCFYAHSVQVLMDAARLLNKQEDVQTYSDLLQRVKNAFLKEYVTPNGRLISNTQTAYVLALHFDLLPEAMRQPTVERLVQNIRRYNNHLTTGFLGTPYLCHVLTRFGHTDVAYQLLLQKTYPSWLYPVSMGATTIWERWDSMKPDSTFQDPGMTSFNHYAYGAVGDWMYQVIAGLNPSEQTPGYRKIIIRPHPGGGLTHATATHESLYGKIVSGWRIGNDHLLMEVEIPANTTATVYLPTADADAITEGGRKLVEGLKPVASDRQRVVVELGSGTYRFVINGFKAKTAL